MLCPALFSFSLPLLTFSASALCLCSLPNSAEPPRAGLSSHNPPTPSRTRRSLSLLLLSAAPDPDPTRRSVSSWLRAARWDSSLDRSSWLRAARWDSSSDQSSWLMAAPGVCWVCGSVMVGLCDGGFAVMVALWVCLWWFAVDCGGGYALAVDTECCWLNLVEWATKNFKGNRFRMAICKLAWWAEEQIVRDIRKDVKGRMESLSKVQGSVNRIWCCTLGVNPVALCNGHKSQLGSLRHLLSISCSK
uniref:Uncharacterized protein n=1 Tax=Fagus sylvatica TaxID=28930 RepID=A0A2N9H4Z6_FAGSY